MKTIAAFHPNYLLIRLLILLVLLGLSHKAVTQTCDTINQSNQPVANAGPNLYVCRGNPATSLSGSATNATGVLWMGGSGSFSPSATVLTPVYTPSQTELTAGVVTLYLKADNGICPPDYDTLKIYYRSFTGIPDISVTDVSCHGLADGQIQAGALGAVGPYNVLLNGSPVTSPIQSLTAGTYNVTILDSYGCDTTLQVQLTEPPPVTASVSILSAIQCFADSSGSVQLNVNGGVQPFTYALNGQLSGGSQVNGLPAGSYTFSVTDAAGCSDSTLFTLSQPPVFSVTPGAVTDVNCAGDSTGQGSVIVNGGTPPFSYNWNNISSISGPSVGGLPAGTYLVTVTDANNCQQSVSLEVNEPPPLTVNPQLQQVSCHSAQDGQASIQVSGGTAPYQYTWNGTSSGTNNYQNLGAGAYILAVQDQKGCIVTDTVQIIQPQPIQVNTVVLDHVSCHGLTDGSAQVNTTGGVQPYQYVWNTNPSQQTATAAGLAAGTYQVQVSDSNGCQHQASVIINEPAPLVAVLNSEDPDCYGSADGKVTAQATGGTPPYFYTWNNGSQNTMILNLTAGFYQVILQDAENCVDTASVQLSQPAPISASISSPVSICPGDTTSISVVVNGGTGPYLYQWNYGLSPGHTHLVSPAYSSTYIATVSDSNDCVWTDSVKVHVKNLDPDSIQATIQPVLCEGGEAVLHGTVTPPAWPYSLTWSHGLGNAPGSFTVSPSVNTIYTFTLTDVCNNTITDTAGVEVHPFPAIKLPVLLAEGCPSLQVEFPADAVEPAGSTLFWEFGDGTSSDELSPVHTFKESGTFGVSVKATTLAGCSRSFRDVTSVNVYPAPVADFEFSSKQVNLLNPVLEVSNYSLGATSYQWQWSDKGISADFEPEFSFEEAGLYHIRLTVTNEFGCESIKEDEVLVESDFAFYVPNAISPDGDGINDFFDPKGTGMSEEDFALRIFSRSGELVFQSENPANKWDGSDRHGNITGGTYIYQIRVRDIFDRHHDYSGHLTVFR